MSEVLLPSEEQDRADLYALFAALLLTPDLALVRALAALPRQPAPPDSFAASWNALLAAAARCGEGVRGEFDALFVSTGTPRLNPYQCYYLAGWLMDKPLAALREDLRRLGLARGAEVTELEDHLGALCEAMRMLVQRDAPLTVQRGFFGKHLAGWSGQCLRDIAADPAADFYRALAECALAFFALEACAFALDADDDRTACHAPEDVLPSA